MRTHLFLSPVEESVLKAISRDCDMTIDSMLTAWARYIIEMAQVAMIDNILFFAPDEANEAILMSLTSGPKRYANAIKIWEHTRKELHRIASESGEEGKWSLMLAAMMDRDDYMDMVQETVSRDREANLSDRGKINRFQKAKKKVEKTREVSRANIFMGWCTHCLKELTDEEIIHEILHADGAGAINSQCDAATPDPMGHHGLPPESE